MELEAQLQELSGLGLTLNEGVNIDDLLYSFGRDDYENRPFDLILFVLGTEVERQPWGRSFCSSVWNFDSECIYETGDYVAIVQRLCELADCKGRITDLEDFIDVESGDAWLAYKVDGNQRGYTVTLEDDWVDVSVISQAMGDIESDGFRFYFLENGQSMVLFYLEPSKAQRLNELSRKTLEPMMRSSSSNGLLSWMAKLAEFFRLGTR